MSNDIGTPASTNANWREEMLSVLSTSDSVELKLTLPESNQRSAVVALGMDPLDAQLRQVFFFDTPDLELYRAGLVLRARRLQRRGADSVVKLRPVRPDQIPARLRGSKGLSVEVDAGPDGYVCSASMKAVVDDELTRAVVAGRQPVSWLFGKRQRALMEGRVPAGVELDALAVLGPITVLKLKFTPEDLDRRLVAEMWLYPDNSRVLELSARCTTAEPFDVAAHLRAYLNARGVDLTGEQQTKTRSALEFYSREMTRGPVAAP